MHERRRIREAVAATLTADVTITETVEDSRALSLSRDEMPRLFVYTRGDRVLDEWTAVSPRRYARETIVTVECVSEWSRGGGSNVAAELDDIAERVEAALAVSQVGHLDNTVQAFEYRGSEFRLEADGDLKLGVLALEYAAIVIDVVAATLPDYDGADVDYHRGAPGDFPEGPHAEDDGVDPT